MTARGEMVKAAGLTNPNRKPPSPPVPPLTPAPRRRTRQFIWPPAQTAGGRANWFYTPGGLPPHAQVFLRCSGIAGAPASP
jgi:hypothetical protein